MVTETNKGESKLESKPDEENKLAKVSTELSLTQQQSSFPIIDEIQSEEKIDILQQSQDEAHTQTERSQSQQSEASVTYASDDQEETIAVAFTKRKPRKNKASTMKHTPAPRRSPRSQFK